MTEIDYQREQEARERLKDALATNRLADIVEQVRGALGARAGESTCDAARRAMGDESLAGRAVAAENALDLAAAALGCGRDGVVDAVQKVVADAMANAEALRVMAAEAAKQKARADAAESDSSRLFAANVGIADDWAKEKLRADAAEADAKIWQERAEWHVRE